MLERGNNFLPKNKTPQYFPFENTEGSYFLMHNHQTLDFFQCLAFKTDIIRPILPCRYINIHFPCLGIRQFVIGDDLTEFVENINVYC